MSPYHLYHEIGAHFDVQYIGYIVIKKSLKDLYPQAGEDIGRECIYRVIEGASIKPKTERQVNPIVLDALDDHINLLSKNSDPNVRLTIMTKGISVHDSNENEVLFGYELKNVANFCIESPNFFGFIAKNENERCHVFQSKNVDVKDMIEAANDAFILKYKDIMEMRVRNKFFNRPLPVPKKPRVPTPPPTALNEIKSSPTPVSVRTESQQKEVNSSNNEFNEAKAIANVPETLYGYLPMQAYIKKPIEIFK